MSIEKLDLKSPDLVNENFEKLVAVFPNCVTETIDGKAIDFDLLKQELSHAVVEGNKERYRLEWPGKKEAIVTANIPTNKTLRPVREDSVDFDNTENLYIEGDNLEVLKLLQESYLGKIKMIYIDPPYNTGKDFVYKDNFTSDKGKELLESGQKDEYNQRLVANPETAGRYHSDWLTMMYPRLKLARNLLKNEGLIFISIDDHEVSSLKAVCDELFGQANFIASLIWDTNHSAQAGIFKVYHQYILVYAKNLAEVKTPNALNNDQFEAGAMKRESKRHPMQKFRFPKGTRFDAPDGKELVGSWGGAEKVILHEGRMIAQEGKLSEDIVIEAAFTQANQMKQYFYGDRESLVDSRGQKVTEFYFNSSGKIKIVKTRGVDTPQTTRKYSTQGAISKKLADLFELSSTPLDSPKPVDMVQEFAAWFLADDEIVLDFFSGSATTAESLISLNSQDDGNRSFILVQLPEKTASDGEAFRAGYKNICEIGKERIRRAAKKIKEETDADIDYGFRVYRLDESNMQDVYYRPQDYKQDTLDMFEDNVKPDRTADDLLAQVMLDWGLPLSLKIEKVKVSGKQVFKVAGDSLYACFDKGIDEDFAKEIAKDQPLRIVFRDNGFKNDTAKTNVKQLLKQLSPETEMKVI
jgi:adenine-specific DNA-methyltransferase